ncbi:hypothetical protein JCM4814A_46040 [Streptomyces phaeofaciens JCM 4814]|uniref:Uncharacterized protein n=1 Tax=Streptomyces phaeofaciens TaxID=68254 RepID=A0A918H2X5_9ACTN|nr:hypothetical protein GCM10010226_02720 [Streptomyces phaeofaciens]
MKRSHSSKTGRRSGHERTSLSPVTEARYRSAGQWAPGGEPNSVPQGPAPSLSGNGTRSPSIDTVR